ncbi:MAG: hypothetical protein DRP06_03575 [Candidatus Aenigmatarchaeota archaeon]|nr:MAG: hypothetical protein DRP06_03575 [Candidatus Aenigmarchaeota archaeon]
MKRAFPLCRGQIFSFDFLIACSIFILVLVILIGHIGYNTLQLNELKDKHELIRSGYKLSGIFFMEGYPKDWNSSNVEIIGLQTDNRIDWNKLKEFENIGYQKSLILLGLKYDYNITIGNYTFGENPENASSAFIINRVGILNSSVVPMQIIIFKL